jgi:hypothetical protein
MRYGILYLPSLLMESGHCSPGARGGRYLEGALSSRRSDVLRADISIEDLVSVDETSIYRDIWCHHLP